MVNDNKFVAVGYDPAACKDEGRFGVTEEDLNDFVEEVLHPAEEACVLDVVFACGGYSLQAFQ